ncbi:MAG: photosynthetic complex putative assembly protein PuhB, partial [Pseudomonadota bacterium]
MKQPQDTWSGDQVLVPESTEELPELPEELPEALPRGERIVWQGKPSLQGLLQGTFHFRLLAIYFSVLIGILFAIQFRGGGSVASSASDVLGYVIMAAFAMGIIWVFAFLLARTTTYSITTHRVVMQCGVALPVTMSFPFPLIESADVRIRRDGSGEIALLPESANPLVYVLLFPHVKPLSIFRVKPVLRGIPDAAAVATDLARLMTDDWQDAMAAGKAAPSRRSDEPPKRDVGFWELNGVPLALAAGLTIFTLGGAWLMQEKNAAFGGGLSAEASTTVDLFFEDRENGAVEVV